MDFDHKALGKVFISHASADKPFVRGLVRKLQDANFGYWLDERELRVGDQLAHELSDALAKARAVIVVVSKASLESSWLRFELNKAIQRMVEGHCRVLPVLIDDIEPPPELSGVFYADCRPGRRGGIKKLLDALDFEASRYPQTTKPSLESDNTISRWSALRELRDSVFDGSGSASASISATRDLDWTVVVVRNDEGAEVDVVTDEVMSYIEPSSPISVADWDDWCARVHDEIQESLSLLLTERPLDAELAKRLVRADHYVWHETAKRGLSKGSRADVIVDVSDRPGEEDARERLQIAYRLLRGLSDRIRPSVLQDLLDRGPEAVEKDLQEEDIGE